MLRRNVQNAHLRGQNQTVVIGDVIAGGTQAVPIQRCTQHVAVREQNGGRTVPGLHHGRIVMIEILLVLLHEAVVLPGLGHDHHHGKGQRHSVHVKEFQRIVQHGGIGARLGDDREDLVDVLLHDRRGHGFLTGQHTVNVASNGIDLSVVRDHAIGMRAVPGGSGIGGEAGVHDGNGRLVIPILQIVIEFAQLHNKEHALVYNGAGGKGADIGILRTLLKLSSHHIEHAVKGNALLHEFRLLDKTLHDAGHGILCQVAQNFRMHRHRSPSQKPKSLLADDDLQHTHRKGSLERILREKEHADAVFPLLADLDAGSQCRLFEKFMADLGQNTHAVTHLAGGILPGPVLQLLNNMQGIVQNLIVLVAVDVHNGADSAGIVLLLQTFE